jgi:hypothetical protein
MAISLIPENLNPLSPNGFQFVIQKIPEMVYFTQEVPLPGVSLPRMEMDTPFTQIKVPGSKMEFEPLTINFLVDENMTNYLAIFNWIAGLGHPQEFEQYTSFMNRSPKFIMTESANNYSDGNLEILGSNNTVVQTVKFVDLIPTSLSGLTFATTNTDVTYITASATFEYTYFVFE